MSSRLSQTGKQAMINRGGALFNKYRMTIHKNTLNALDYYWYAWSEEERKAMELLAPREALETSQSMMIKCPSIAGKREYLDNKPRVRLHFGPDRYTTFPFPHVEITDEQITDPELRKKLLAWVVRDYQLRHWQRKFDTYARALTWGSTFVYVAINSKEGIGIPAVNTPGQLYRAWPEFASLVEKKYTERMAGQKLKSSMPSGWSDEVMKAWRNLPYMDEINQVLLTIAIMEDELQHDRTYPDGH